MTFSDDDGTGDRGNKGAKLVSSFHKDVHIGSKGASDKPSNQSSQKRGVSKRRRPVKADELSIVTTKTQTLMSQT